MTRPFGLAEYPLAPDPRRRKRGDIVFIVILTALLAWGAFAGLSYLGRAVGFGVFPYAIGLGAITFARVVVVVLVSTLIWVPIGVTIGMNPRLARLAQPVVQILASFPSNLSFAFILMAIGAQWYILFNAIAGAIAIPNDLREMATDFDLPRKLRWRKLILPAIFPAYVTGGITAAGGAWNASIVAEVVVWGQHHLSAEGLGAYIANAANSAAPDHFAKVLAGVIVMSLFVVFVNRFLWRRLYRLAESHFSL
jgi:NitT/TauT family transport system permease protein